VETVPCFSLRCSAHSFMLGVGVRLEKCATSIGARNCAVNRAHVQTEERMPDGGKYERLSSSHWLAAKRSWRQLRICAAACQCHLNPCAGANRGHPTSGVAA
jgi:hypothetical protein